MPQDLFSLVQQGEAQNIIFLSSEGFSIFMFELRISWSFSTWVMMNRQTRRLSKMPDEVRAEISPWFIGQQSIEENIQGKIEKVDDNAKYII